MNDLEQELRATFASRTAGPRQLPDDLANRAIVRGNELRLRRKTAISAAGVVAVVALLVAVPLLLGPRGGGNATAGGGSGDGVGPPGGGPPVLTTGPPVRVAVFGPHSVRLPDGSDRVVASEPGETVRGVLHAAGGWVVTTTGNGNALPNAMLVRDDRSVRSLGRAVVSVAVNASGDRVAVQTRDGDGQRVDVFEVPSGQKLASTPLPGDVDMAPVVTRWAGELVVLTAPNGDQGPVGTDVWDPTKGPYRSSMSGARLILGPAVERGQLLALEPDSELPNACLTWVDPSQAFAVRTRRCQTGLRFGDGPVWSSPDGQHLVSVAGKVTLVDVPTMTSKQLGLPGNAQPTAVVWEDPGSVLLWLDSSVVRCHLDGQCELAPTPSVDGATPLGFVP